MTGAFNSGLETNVVSWASNATPIVCRSVLQARLMGEINSVNTISMKNVIKCGSHYLMFYEFELL